MPQGPVLAAFTAQVTPWTPHPSEGRAVRPPGTTSALPCTTPSRLSHQEDGRRCSAPLGARPGSPPRSAHRRRQRAKRPAARHGQHCAGGRGVGNDHVTGRGLGCYWQSRFGDTADTRSDAAIDSAAARPGGSCETGKLDSWREQELSYHWPMLFLLGLIVRALARVLVLPGAADGTKDLRRFRDCARNRCPYGAVPGGRW
jgi:hypothetical protein